MDKNNSTNREKSVESNKSSTMEQDTPDAKKISEQATIKNPKKVPPKEDLRIEDNLEIHNLKGKAKRQAKRERIQEYTEGMSKKEKVAYYVYYYKWKALFGAIIIIAFISLTKTLYLQNRPVAISYGVVNCDMYEMDISVLEKDYIDYYGFSKKYQTRNAFPIHYNLETYEEDYAKNPDDISYTSFPTLCDKDYYDVIITDMAGLEYCAKTALVNPLTACLTPDLDKVIREDYADRIVLVENYNGDLTEYAIDISGTEFARKLNPGYDDVYLCFPGTAPENVSNIRRLLNFIFDLGLSI